VVPALGDAAAEDGVEAVEEPEAEAVALGAVTAIGTDAAGFGLTPVPLPVTVSCTDLTEVAVFATGTCACSCVCCEPESTAPILHEAVPFVPQPKLNAGFWLDGDVESWSLTPLMVPPVAHTLTFHWAVWPRVMLASSLCRPTHSSTGVAEASARVKLSSVAVAGAPWSSWVTNALVLAVCFALPAVRPLTSGLIRPVVSAEPVVSDGVGEVPDGLDDEGSGMMLGVSVVDLPGLGEGGVVPEPVGLELGEPVLELELELELEPVLGCTGLQSCLTVPLTAEVCARAV
jgi:hypothetical protein